MTAEAKFSTSNYKISHYVVYNWLTYPGVQLLNHLLFDVMAKIGKQEPFLKLDHFPVFQEFSVVLSSTALKPKITLTIVSLVATKSDAIMERGSTREKEEALR